MVIILLQHIAYIDCCYCT